MPGDPYGPGGILVVCEGFIVYKKVDHEDRECAIPVRNEQMNNRGVFFNCHSTYTSKDLFFFLISNEYGDLFKITLDFSNNQVHALTAQYFDSCSPAS